MLMENKMDSAATTSMVVLGLGAIVTSAGRIIGGRLGAGVTGFGLAHVTLGFLDMLRPTIRQ